MFFSLFLFPEKIEKCYVMFWKIIYFFTKRGEKKIITHDLQAGVNEFSKSLKRDVFDFDLREINIHWITEKETSEEFFKYLNEKIFVESAVGIAADLGIIYHLPYPDIKVGFALQNVGKMNNLKTAESNLPGLVRSGIVYQIPFKSEKMNLIIAGDIVKPIDENVRFNLGTEFVVWQQLALRGGYYIGYEARDISFGVGFLKSSIRLDYGMIPFNDNLGATHRFTINFNL